MLHGHPYGSDAAWSYSPSFLQHSQTLTAHWYCISPAQSHVTACLVSPHTAMAAAQNGLIFAIRQTSFKLLEICLSFLHDHHLTHYRQNTQPSVYLPHRKASPALIYVVDHENELHTDRSGDMSTLQGFLVSDNYYLSWFTLSFQRQLLYDCRRTWTLGWEKIQDLGSA